MQMRRYSRLRDFNPHHPQGGDGLPYIFYDDSDISIHTTRKVVTYVVDSMTISTTISIHTTRKVVTIRRHLQNNRFLFQSTPPARW